jgi:pimeloyl-ACP methyl ester carboxylesterase
VVTLALILICFLGAYVLMALFFYLFQESLLFQSKPLDRDAALAFPFESEERFFTAADGARLHALFIPAEAPKGVILYFHGNAGNLQRWGRIAHSFVHYQYDVLIFDYRGYGKSHGKRSMDALYRDGEMIYDTLRSTYGEQRIVIYGRSIGCAMAIWLAGRTNPKQLMLETPFHSINDVLAFRLLGLPAEWLLRYPFPNYHFIKQVRCAIYIIHGTRDRVVPYSSGRKLFQQNKKSLRMEFERVAGGSHNNLSSFPAFHKAMRRWLT